MAWYEHSTDHGIWRIEQSDDGLWRVHFDDAELGPDYGAKTPERALQELLDGHTLSPPTGPLVSDAALPEDLDDWLACS